MNEDILGSHVLHRSPCSSNQGAWSTQKKTHVSNLGYRMTPSIKNASYLEPDKLGLPYTPPVPSHNVISYLTLIKETFEKRTRPVRSDIVLISSKRSVTVHNHG